MAKISKTRLALDCLAWAALATLPTELASLWAGWDTLAPESYIAEFIWLPITLYSSLKILEALGPAFGLKPPTRTAAMALPSAIGVELLFSLRFCGVALVSLLPAFISLAYLGVATASAKIFILVLFGLGILWPTQWFLERLAASPLVLWEGLNASQALATSARLMQGKLKTVIIPLLLWNCLAQVLEGLGLLSEPLNFIVLPLSLLISLAALTQAYAKLTL